MGRQKSKLIKGELIGSHGLIYLDESDYIIHPSGQTTRMVVAKCHCGVEFIGRLFDIRRNKIKSCGCLRKGIHGLSGTKVHILWKNIKTRCYYKDSWKYKYYGGKGIKVYEPWINDFMVFHSYITSLPGYSDSNKLTLDRIDNDGNYEPGNLRWVTMREQNKNRSI